MEKQECNVYLVTGNDEQLVSAEALRLFRKFAGAQPDDFSSEVISEGDDGPTPELLGSLLASLKSPSFLGGRKTVWLKHFSAFEAEGDRKATEPMAVAIRNLTDFLKGGLSPDMLLIMDGVGIDRRRALFKACSEVGRVLRRERPDLKSRNWRNDMAGLVRDALQEKGMRMEPAAVDYLVDALGTDTARIESELEKVLCYRGGPEGMATLEELQKVCTGKGEEMSWAIGDALGRRDLQKVLRTVDVLITQNRENEGFAHVLLLGAAGFFRNVIRIHVFMGLNRIRGAAALKGKVLAMSDEQKAEAVRTGMEFVNSHPYRIQILAEQAMRYTPNEAIDALNILRDALWQCVSSKTSFRVALESALMKIIGVGRRGNVNGGFSR